MNLKHLFVFLGWAIICSSPNARGQDLTDGLVAYYPFNGNANDESGNENNGTVNGATLTTDRNGNADNALLITTDQGNATSAANIPISGNADRTISFWCKFSSPTDHQPGVQWGINSSNGGMCRFSENVTAGIWFWGHYADNDYPVSGAPYDQWRHLVFVYHSSLDDAVCYANGNVVPRIRPGALNRTNTLNTISTPLKMRGVTGDFIDDVRIYNRTLSGEEVTALYNLEKPTSRRYVRAGASGANDGSSWADAYTDLQAALTTAISGDEIWVAAGTYRPTADPNDRTASFAPPEGVKVYGGFDGTETSRNQRDWRVNRTILTGDLSGDDTANIARIEPTRAENSIHVITVYNKASEVVLDGLVVTGGNADTAFWGAPGALANGGGLRLDASTLTIRNCIFEKNTASKAASLYDEGPGSTLRVENSIFRDNVSHASGTMHVAGDFVLESCVIYNNQTKDSPYGYQWGGGLFLGESSSGLINNSVFANNYANEAGGAIFGQADAVITNCSFYGHSVANEAGRSGQTLNVNGGTLTLKNCIIWGSSGGGSVIDGSTTITNSTIQGGHAGAGNMDVDPQFVSTTNLEGIDGIWGTADDGLHLQNTSPAVDTGLNADAVGSDDLTGRPRIVDGNSDTMATVDMGAYELEKPEPDLNPEEVTADALNDSLSFAVNVPAGTEWRAESLADWLTITSGSSGTGSGTVSYTVSRNSSTEEREAQIRVSSGATEASEDWEIATVDSFIIPRWNYLSVDYQPSGQPAIAYRTSDSLRYAFYNGSEWIVSTVDDSSNGEYTNKPSLRHLPDGTPVIAYRKYNSDADQRLQFAEYDGENWTITTIEENAGDYASLSIGPDGNPAIAYCAGDATLRYAAYDGSNWNFADVAGRPRSISLQHRPDGQPAIAVTIDNSLIYATLNEGTWQVEDVASQFEHSNASLSHQSNGNPAIATNFQGRLYYAAFDGSNWQAEEIAIEGATWNTVTLLHELDDTPAIAYYNRQFLGYLTREDNEWNRQVVDPDNAGDSQVRMARTATGDTSIAYLDKANMQQGQQGTLRIARRQGAAPGITLTHTVTQPAIDPGADTDGDGILDIHETNTGIFVDADNTGSDPRVVDSDGDGFNDGEELAGGGDPNDATSLPSVGLVVNKDLGTLGVGSVDLVGDTGAGADNAQGYTAAGTVPGGWASNEWVYQFSIDQDLIVTITSNSVVGDPDPFLLDSLETADNEGNRDATGALASAYLDGIPPETVSFGILPAGTYYISVDAWGTGLNAEFNFTLDFSEFVLNTPTTAIDLGIIGDGNSLTTLDTFGSAWSDTEMACYLATGELIDNNDDAPGTAQSQLMLGLPEGIYYVAVSTYNTVFGDNFDVSGGGKSGEILLNFYDGVAAVGSRTVSIDGGDGVGGVAWFTFEIGEVEARLVKVTFNEDLTAANLFLEWLTPGELYHVTGSVDGEAFFHFHDSEFTADARDLEVVQPVDVAFRRKLLLRVKEGPIPQDP